MARFSIKSSSIVILFTQLIYGVGINIPNYFINPGIKICYEFGSKPGFSLGPEISFGRRLGNELQFCGIVL